MSVPPTNRRSSSTPSGKGRPDDAKNEKEFKLPSRKEHVEAKEEELKKKKGLFDIAAEEMKMQEKQQGMSEEMKTEAANISSISETQAVAQVNQVSQLIQRMVETMRIGQLDGQDFASMNLKKSAEVPEAFTGSNLTLSFHENGLAIRFDNFMSPQQQNTAITLVEKNKEQLQQMVQALNSKNIQVTEFTIGTHTVALPRVQSLPPPFEPILTTRAETEQQRGGREGREEREEGGPER